ncbi:MAG: pantoate--beta-alanine ligase [Rhodospirillaceae bacterium]|jgi:pantoate--beta-alanine ligase|nr:pantoate--beta-alanine ligase [Rhodospirillaceae bacterium]MBT5373264.1 pantoate--beta-alanine ligase [Rhodospirillaceae bacterium]MBT5658742.1 pantoate--beta-alanine ligase [Rhodospirillaceae bacterium]MBT5752742.1 pantoate--beta-alanine ligase [Rhodospirillaceae bacterium]
MTSSSPNIALIRKVSDLRQRVSHWRGDGCSVGLVPTMGALHDGHLSLVKKAKAECDRVVVSIFVNPTQFGAGEDLAAYPRDEKSDRSLLDALGVDALYAPGVDEIYPKDFSTMVQVEGVSEGLCGAVRPVHFAGVATVVTKLLMQARPDAAYFGEKDYQQLCVIKRLVCDLDMDVRIVGVPTVREADGLALSSRNAYLKKSERLIAPVLYETLIEIAEKIEAGGDPEQLAALGREKLLKAGFRQVDYLEVCDSVTLVPVSVTAGELRILVAAHIGKARLIDNVPAKGPA